MPKHTIDEIVAWWKEIERLERKGAAVDILAFAEAAHEFIPTLLAELARSRVRDGMAEPAMPSSRTSNGFGDRARAEVELARLVN